MGSNPAAQDYVQVPQSVVTASPEGGQTAEDEIVGTPNTHALQSTPAVSAARRIGPSKKILYTTLGVTILVSGLVIILVAYIFLIHNTTSNHNHVKVISSAYPTLILAISSTISFVVAKTITVVVSLVAYFIAANWLVSSDPNRPAPNRPTPSQYAQLLSVLQGPSLMASLKVTFGLGGRGRQATPTTPPIVKRAAALVGCVVTTSLAVSLFDTWFHATMLPLPSIQYKTYPGDQPRNYGRTLDTQRCQTQPETDTAATATCGLITGSPSSALEAGSLGLRVLGNASESTLVAFSDDQTSILAPLYPTNIYFGKIFQQMQTILYVAETYGVRSSCQSIAHQCITQPMNNSSVGGNSTPTFNCSGSPTVTLDQTLLQSGGTPFGVLHGQDGTVTSAGAFSAITSNPFPLIGVVNSLAYVGDSGSYVNDTGFYYAGMTGAWNILYCNVSTYRVLYQFNNTDDLAINPQYSTLEATLAPLNYSVITGAMLDSQLIEAYTSMQVEGIGLHSGDYADAFASALSRTLIGFSSLAYEPSEAVSINQLETGERSSILVPALVGYIAVVVAYVVLTVLIGVAAYRACGNVPFAELAYMRLTSPYPTIQAAFATADSQRTWNGALGELFHPNTGLRERLGIGEIAGSDGAIAFGVSRTLLKDSST